MRPLRNGRFSIPTTYQGVEFASKLEADWARFFDGIGLPWKYEPGGIYVAGLFVLPDFLVGSRDDPKQMAPHYFEVKGSWASEMEVRKYQALAQEQPLPVVIGGPNGLLGIIALDGMPGPGELVHCGLPACPARSFSFQPTDRPGSGDCCGHAPQLLLPAWPTRWPESLAAGEADWWAWIGDHWFDDLLTGAPASRSATDHA